MLPLIRMKDGVEAMTAAEIRSAEDNPGFLRLFACIKDFVLSRANC